MSSTSFRRVDSKKAWANDVNPLVDAHLGNVGAGRLWVGWDGTTYDGRGNVVTTNNFSDVVKSTIGRHTSVRHSAGSADTPADQVFATLDGYALVGRGGELRFYNTLASNYANLKHSGTNDVLKTDDALHVATALSVGTVGSAADAGDGFFEGGVSVGVYSNPAQGEVRFGNNASGLGIAKASTTAAELGALSNIPVKFLTNNTARAQIDTSGHLRPEADATYDLGVSAAKWRTGYFNTSLGIGVAPSVGLHVSKAQAADYVASLENTSNAASTKGLQVKSAGTGAADPVLNVEAGGTQMFNVFSAGLVGIGPSPSNSFMTTGLTIDQGANDNQALALNSSDVAHGITDQLGTSTYGALLKQSATDGGLIIRSATEATISVHLQSFATTEDSTRSTSGAGYAQTSGWLKSGTTLTTPSANVNLLAVRAGTSTRFILDSDGDSHQDVGTAWTNFDDHDDAALLTALSAAVSRPGDPVRERFLDVLESNRDSLERARLVAFNEDGHHFVNMSRLLMVCVGAIRQQATRIDALTTRLHALEAG